MLSRPIVAMLAITLGFPVLMLVALTASNPDIGFGIFRTILGGSIVMAGILFMVIEIKRLADEPDEPHRH